MGLRLHAVRRNALAIPGFLALALLLSSCITISAESDFREDGSARHIYEFTFEKKALAEMGEFGEFDPEGDFADVEDLLQGSGYSVELIDTEELIGSRVSITTDDSENVGEILNDLFSAGADGGTQPVTAFAGTFGQDGNEHTLDLTVDGSSLLNEGMEDEELGDTAGFSANMLAGVIDMTYTVSMPGEVDAERTNGQVLDDGRIRWDLPLSDSQEFLAVSETEDDSASILLILGGAGVFLLLAVGAVVVGFLLMRRKPQPVPAPSYAAGDIPTAPLPPAQPED